MKKIPAHAALAALLLAAAPAAVADEGEVIVAKIRPNGALDVIARVKP